MTFDEIEQKIRKAKKEYEVECHYFVDFDKDWGFICKKCIQEGKKEERKKIIEEIDKIMYCGTLTERMLMWNTALIKIKSSIIGSKEKNEK